MGKAAAGKDQFYFLVPTAGSVPDLLDSLEMESDLLSHVLIHSTMEMISVWSSSKMIFRIRFSFDFIVN